MPILPRVKWRWLVVGCVLLASCSGDVRGDIQGECDSRHGAGTDEAVQCGGLAYCAMVNPAGAAGAASDNPRPNPDEERALGAYYQCLGDELPHQTVAMDPAST